MHQYPTIYPNRASGIGMEIYWQIGPMDKSVNGSMPEQPIRAVIARLEQYQQTTPCKENAEAIELLHRVLHLFDARIRDRFTRGVMGTDLP